MATARYALQPVFVGCMEAKSAEEVQKEVGEKRRAFEKFLGAAEIAVPQGKKKEAVEKIFFLTEQQFADISDDLLEEIQRRGKEGEEGAAAHLPYRPEYAQKRNAIREQLALLEAEELKSLVEDTLLVLRHKHPQGPPDRLECLNQLVEDLQQIVASNTPLESPTTTVKQVEGLRREIEAQQGFVPKVEKFVDGLPDALGDSYPPLKEVHQTIKAAIEDERKRAQQIVPVSPALEAALLEFCLRRGSEKYLERANASSQISDGLAKRRVKLAEASEEFIRIAKAMPVEEKPKEQDKLKAAPAGGKPGALQPQAGIAPTENKAPTEKKDAVEEVVRKVSDAFGEIEACIERSCTGNQLQQAVSLLLGQRSELIRAFKASLCPSSSLGSSMPPPPPASASKLKMLESLPTSAATASEAEAIEVARKFYAAIANALP